MIFQRFFKPKWQHKDPQVRKNALQALTDRESATASIMRETALVDPDVNIRCLAIKRLFEMSTLDQIIAATSESRVKLAAQNRLLLLLSGKTSPSSEISHRLQRVERCVDMKWLENLAVQAAEPQLRLLALQKISREALLGDVACQDVDALVRQFAAGKIQRKSTLERVWKASKGKDKRVSGIAKQRLMQIDTDEQRPALLQKQAKQVCLNLEALRCDEDRQRIHTRMQQLAQQWQQIQVQWEHAGLGAFSAELQIHFQNTLNEIEQFVEKKTQREVADQALAAEQEPIREQKRALLAAIEQRVVQWQADALDEQASAQLRLDIEQWAQAVSKVAVLDIVEHRQFENRYTQALKTLTLHLQDFELCRVYAMQLTELIDQAKHVDDAKLTVQFIDQLRRRKAELQTPKQYSVDKNHEAQFDAALEKLQKKSADLIRQRAEAKQKLMQNIDQFTQAMAAGRLNACIKLRKSITRLIDGLRKDDLEKIRRLGLWKKYQHDSKQFQEIYKWRSWANTPVKQTLCHQVEELLAEVKDPSLEQDYNAIAQMVKQKRLEWKKIGQSDAEDEQQLWFRFDTSCNEIYELCKKYFQQQSQTRKDNRCIKEQVCNDLEHYVKQLNWAQVQWNVVEKIISTATREWRSLGPVDRKNAQQLNERFKQALDVLKTALGKYRQECKDGKLVLIQHAENIATQIMASVDQQEEIKVAINNIKKLQGDWKKIGQAAKEHGLWQKFRCVCDTVFNLRDGLINLKDVQFKHNMREKTEICAQIDALLADPGDDLLGAADKVRQAFLQLEGVVGGAGNKHLASKIKQLQEKFTALERQAEWLTKRKQIEGLQTKAELCDALERQCVLDTSGQFDTNILCAQWAQLAKGDPSLDAVIHTRFDRALDMSAKIQEQRIGPAAISAWQYANQARKEQLCLRLEILLGLESPAQFQKARMEYQVTQLANKLSGESAANKTTAEQHIEPAMAQWFAIGRAENEAELQARFAKILELVLAKLDWPASALSYA